MKVGGGVNNEGLVFGYDASGFKFSGEPTTNYIWHQNAVKQDTYTTYSATSSGSWNANHRKAIQVVNSAGSGITGYVNTGVGDWTNTFHCIWEHDDELDKPVAVMYCYDSNWKAKSFGAGMSAWSTYGMSAGDKYTISWLQWTNNLTKAAWTGFYSKDTNGSWNFHDGLQGPTNTKTHTWERVYATYTVSGNRNLSDSSGNVYMYGHSVGSNSRPTILKIADVQLELKDHPTKFSPTLTRSNTEGLLDFGPNNVTINTSNINWSSNQYPSFNGSTTYMDIPAGSWNILTTFTLEAVFKSNGAPGSGYHVLFQKEGGYSGGSVYGLRCNPAGGTFYAMLFYDAQAANGFTLGSSTVMQDGTWYHVVSTFDSSYNWKIYINGVLENQTTLTNVPYQNSSIISTGLGDGRRMNGELPVMRIYNTPLSDKEVEQNYLSFKNRFGLS